MSRRRSGRGLRVPTAAGAGARFHPRADPRTATGRRGWRRPPRTTGRSATSCACRPCRRQAIGQGPAAPRAAQGARRPDRPAGTGRAPPLASRDRPAPTAGAATAASPSPRSATEQARCCPCRTTRWPAKRARPRGRQRWPARRLRFAPGADGSERAATPAAPGSARPSRRAPAAGRPTNRPGPHATTCSTPHPSLRCAPSAA